MNKSTLLASVVAFGAVAASSNATLIDFNGLSEGTIVSNQFAGVTFSAGPGSLTVPDAGGSGFASNTGMSVTSTDLGGLGTPVLVSGMVLHSFNDWLNEDGDPVFVITFSNSITAFSADFNGIAIPASTGIYAYAGGVNVASSVATTTTGGQTLSFTGLSGVTQIAITAGEFGDWVGVDNINYTTSTVPEPASFAVLGLGALALIRRRRTKV